MSQARYIVGDSLEELRKMEDASVDLVITSPPFLALRSYLPPEHPDKAKEMGSEASPGVFLDRLLDVVEELRRVLAPHGSLVVELGDSYSGSGGSGGDYAENGMREGQAKWQGTAKAKRSGKPSHSLIADRFASSDRRNGWPLAKSLTMIPELLRVALAYGFNPLTGRETPRWRVRNVVRWIRPNPPVGALADKFRPATSDFVVACTSRARYFDMEAVRTPHSAPPETMGGNGGAPGRPLPKGQTRPTPGNPAAAPLLDWFEQDEGFPEALKVTAGGYRGAHYAVFPEKVVGPFIESMCPRRVCTECGEPSRRIVQVTNSVGKAVRARADGRHGRTDCLPSSAGPDRTESQTLGWTDCGHDSWRRGRVLDPFAGTGTVLAVAVGTGREAIGIDLDERNADLARERVGMFLEVATS